MFGKPVHSEELRPVYPISLYNTSREMATQHVTTQGGKAGTQAVPPQMHAMGTYVYVKNACGEVRKPGEILGIDDDLIIPLDHAGNRESANATPILKGVEPAFPDHIGKFVVLVEGLGVNEVGLAYLSGIAVVKVNFTYANSPFADVTDENYTKLTAREFGGARIISKESGTGDKYALVELGTLWTPPVHGILDQVLADLSTAVMTIYKQSAAGPWLSTSRQVEIDHGGMFNVSDGTLEIGAFCVCVPNKDSGIVNLINASKCVEL